MEKSIALRILIMSATCDNSSFSCKQCPYINEDGNSCSNKRFIYHPNDLKMAIKTLSREIGINNDY